MLVRISIVTRVTIYFVTTVTQLPARTSANATKIIRYQIQARRLENCRPPITKCTAQVNYPDLSHIPILTPTSTQFAWQQLKTPSPPFSTIPNTPLPALQTVCVNI